MNEFNTKKNLNEKEIQQKKIKLDSFMKRLIVTLSSRCNLDCIMCEVRRTKWDIPQEVIKEIIDLFPYLESISWQGGEPFILEYFKDLFKQASEFNNLKQTIVTNGLFITEDWAEKLASNNVELTFSIDGITKEVYEHIREGAEFKDVIHSLKIIRDAKKKYKSKSMLLRLHVVVMKSNYHQLEGVIDFANEYGFDAIHLISVWGGQAKEEDLFYKKDKNAIDYIEGIREKLQEKAKRYNIDLLNALPRRIDNNSDSCLSFQEINNEHTNPACILPWQQLNIDPGGGVRPDCLCLKTIGSVLDNSIKELWNCESMQLYREKILNKDFDTICNPTCLAVQMSEQSKREKTVISR